MAGKRPGDTSGDMVAKRALAAAFQKAVIAGKPPATTVSAGLRRSEMKHDTYVVRIGDSHVVTTVTARPDVARRWVCAARWRHGRRLRSGAGVTVGMGVQWTPSFRALADGSELRPGTLQLCVGNRCLVFQIATRTI